MSPNVLFVLLVVAAAVTLPVVVLTPRQRQSAAFDRLLWLATAFVAFLGAILGYAFGGGGADTSGQFVIGGIPLLPALAGALAGALLTNLPLLLLDRFERREEPFEEEWEDDALDLEDLEQADNPQNGSGKQAESQDQM